MEDVILRAMAEDLGISKFINESDIQYASRVLYSALACWIKAVALDQLTTNTDQAKIGVSRRHIIDKCSRILDEMLKRNPAQKAWFEMTSADDNPVALIRSRLIRNGELLNVGFKTNLTLSGKETVCLSDHVRRLKGEILIDGTHYSGISVLDYTTEKLELKDTTMYDTKLWFEEYIKNAWWRRDAFQDDSIQYFDAYKKVRNNYSCWQSTYPQLVDGIVLARRSVNKNAYEYLLIRQDEDIFVHRIDPFLKEMGEHRRFMIALRCLACNNVLVDVKTYLDHVHIKLHTYLPQTEKNLLESYAWPSNSICDELEWDMPERVWEYISKYLSRLGLTLMEAVNG